MLRELRKELSEASVERGESLQFSATEETILAQICTILDRKAEFLVAFEDVEEIKVRLKISAEVRLLEQAAARLVKDIKTEIQPAPSLTTSKASRAARTRWDRDRASGQ